MIGWWVRTGDKYIAYKISEADRVNQISHKNTNLQYSMAMIHNPESKIPNPLHEKQSHYKEKTVITSILFCQFE